MSQNQLPSPLAMFGLLIILGATLFSTALDGRNDLNNVMTTVNTSIFGLALVVLGSRSS